MKLHKISVRTWLAAGLAALLAACQTAPSAPPLDKMASDRIIAQARSHYYNLERAGLARFECSYHPDWKQIFAKIPDADPKTTEWMTRELNRLEFKLNVSQHGVALTHSALKVNNARLQRALTMIYGGVETMSNGVFTAWHTFMHTQLLPPPGSDYQLRREGSGYRLSFDSQGATVVEMLDKDGVITRFEATSQNLSTKMTLAFTPSPEGLLYAGFDGTFEGMLDSSATSKNVTERVRLGYQKINGFWLPKTSTANVKMGDGRSVDLVVAYDHCRTFGH